MQDAVVIGAGLFGQIIAAALRAQGRSVAVLDCNMPEAGSKPAACLMKPSWFSSMGRGVHEPSLDLLDRLYGVHDIEFVTRPKLLKATVHWCDPRKILAPKPSFAQVRNIFRTGKNWTVAMMLQNGVLHGIDARMVVVAAGIWTQRLMPEYQQVGQKGIAFLWPTLKGGTAFIGAPPTPFISPWAPYRQMVGFDRGDGYWFSDGTAIRADNWTDERETASWERAKVAVDLSGHGQRYRAEARALRGIRPYARGEKPCLLKQPQLGLWVASGGAKNGTIAAGWCAHVISGRS